MLIFQLDTTGLKPVALQTDMESRDKIASPWKNGLIGLYITEEWVSQEKVRSMPTGLQREMI